MQGIAKYLPYQLDSDVSEIILFQGELEIRIAPENLISNNSASKSSMIYINPNSSAENSAHSSKRGSRAGIDVEEDGDEAEEARLRSMLLKQIGRKRSKSRDSKKGDFSNPDSPNTVMINPVKINPTVMHRKSYFIFHSRSFTPKGFV